MSEQSPDDRRLDLLLEGAAALVSAGVFTSLAAPYGMHLDTGEFVSVAVDLGLSHPPGHPLASLALSLARVLPFGPLSLRVALVSGLALAFGLVPLHRMLRSLAFSSGASVAVARMIATVLVLAFGLFPATLLQATRPEVYALSAALAFAALEPLVRATLAPEPRERSRALVSSAFFCGLGLANHHLTILLLGPAFLVALVPELLATRGRALGRVAAAVFPGLAAYVLLPLRTAASPDVTLGAAGSLSQLGWVVSAQAFGRNQGHALPQPLFDRFADVGDVVLAQLSWTLAPAALLGLVFALARPQTARAGGVLGLVAAAGLLARAWLGFVRGNPDALGYLLPAMAAVVALAAVALGRVASLGPARFRVPVGVALGVFGLVDFVPRVAALRDGGFANLVEPDALDDATLRSLPPRTVLFAFYPQTGFRAFGVDADLCDRPDVTLVPMPFLSYPGFRDRLVRRHPELRDAIPRAAPSLGTLAALRALASRRPVRVEMDPRLPGWLLDAVVPRGAFLALEVDPPDEAVRRAAYRETARAFSALATVALASRDEETRLSVGYRSMELGAYFAAVGARAASLAHLELAHRLLREDADVGAAMARMRASREGVRVRLARPR